LFVCFDLRLGTRCDPECCYLSGAGVDVLGSALVPVGQELDGGSGGAEPQQLRSPFVQEAVVIEHVLVQHRSVEDVTGEEEGWD